MKGGSKLFLVAGVGLAIVAIGLLIFSMGGDGGGNKTGANQEATPVAEVTVVQAAVAIPAHTLLKAEDLIEVKMSVTSAPADAVATTSEVLNLSYRVPLAQGQTLVRSQTEQPGIRNDIKPGMRAASIPADAVSMLSGLVQDGDFVDIVFHARLDLVRLLPTTLAETPEDDMYTYGGGGGSDGGDDGNGDDGNEEDDSSSLPGSEGGPVMWIAVGTEYVNHPATGDPGSKFYIRDAGDNLEPVAKVMVQDVEVLRVVRPGESFASDGTLAGQAASGEAAPETSSDEEGYLILHVTPEQAEVLTFMQDEANQHTYQIVLRGKDDHENVETTGVTFQVLATGEQWQLPWPQTVRAPEAQVNAQTAPNGQSDDDDDTGDAEATPDANP